MHHSASDGNLSSSISATYVASLRSLCLCVSKSFFWTQSNRNEMQVMTGREAEGGRTVCSVAESFPNRGSTDAGSVGSEAWGDHEESFVRAGRASAPNPSSVSLCLRVTRFPRYPCSPPHRNCFRRDQRAFLQCKRANLVSCQKSHCWVDVSDSPCNMGVACDNPKRDISRSPVLPFSRSPVLPFSRSPVLPFSRLNEVA
jgi:hypothetical protein